MEPMEIDPQLCYTEMFSSRVCEKGTKSCIVRHAEIAKKMLKDKAKPIRAKQKDKYGTGYTR